LSGFTQDSFYPTLDDAWLSGFTQGDGGFKIYIVKRENTRSGYRIRLRYYLDQKDSKSELLYIKSLLAGGVVNSHSDENMFRYTIDSSNKLSIIKNYMIKNILIGQKSIIFDKWAKALNLIETKNHLSKEGFDNILKLKEEILEITQN